MRSLHCHIRKNSEKTPHIGANVICYLQELGCVPTDAADEDDDHTDAQLSPNSPDESWWSSKRDFLNRIVGVSLRGEFNGSEACLLPSIIFMDFFFKYYAHTDSYFSSSTSKMENFPFVE